MRVRFLRILLLSLLTFDLAATAAFADDDSGPTRCVLAVETVQEYLRARALRFGEVPVENVRIESEFNAGPAESNGEAYVYGQVGGVSKILGMVTYQVSAGEPRTLAINVLNVAPALRGQNFGSALVAEAYAKSSAHFKIDAMIGTLNTDNSAAFEAAIDAGKSEADAWKSTPAYKMRKRLGYAKLRLDRCDPKEHRIWVDFGE